MLRRAATVALVLWAGAASMMWWRADRRPRARLAPPPGLQLRAPRLPVSLPDVDPESLEGEAARLYQLIASGDGELAWAFCMRGDDRAVIAGAASMHGKFAPGSGRGTGSRCCLRTHFLREFRQLSDGNAGCQLFE